MVELKTPGEIDAMHQAGQVVARALRAVQDHATPGVRTAELDDVARSVLDEAGAGSPFFKYQPTFAMTPFPAVICTSVNDGALHGIPSGYRLQEGDLLGVDCGALLDGWAADAAVSFSVGAPRADDARLTETAYKALRAGIEAAQPGRRIGDISDAIGQVGRAGGCGISTDYGGHGVGRHMHERPDVPNEGRADRGLRLTPGLVIAIEPWFMGGGDDRYWIDDDGWTIRTADGSRAVHVEHTVAITESGPRILTALP